MTLLAFGVLFATTKQYPLGQLNPANYLKYSIAACVLMVVAILVSSLGTHRFIPYFNRAPKRSLALRQVFAEMGETLKHRSFIVLTVSALFSAIAAGTLASLNTYFNTFFLGAYGPTDLPLEHRDHHCAISGAYRIDRKYDLLPRTEVRDILNERYARGEITREQFGQLKSDIASE
jgi:hypothetical protein